MHGDAASSAEQLVSTGDIAARKAVTPARVVLQPVSFGTLRQRFRVAEEVGWPYGRLGALETRCRSAGVERGLHGWPRSQNCSVDVFVWRDR